jgi:D-alanyl-D-alanine carboxypeptidase
MWVSSLEPVLDAIVRRSAIPSAIVVVRSDSFGDATFIYGKAELGGAEPVTTAHHYRVGSITKSVTATIILQLLQKGRLALDDPVDAYVAGVPDGNGITIADLLNMRSGLFNYLDDLEYLRALDSDRTRRWTPRELLEVAFAHPSYFAAGTGFHYSNTNYILLGLVMEQVTGQSASELFAERVFEPLGMDDSSLPNAENLSVTSPYAHGYGFELDDALDPVLPIEAQTEAAAGTLLPEDWSEFSPSDWTAGGMVSTADDRGLGRCACWWLRARSRHSATAPGQRPEPRRIRLRHRSARPVSWARRQSPRIHRVHGPQPRHRHNGRCPRRPDVRARWLPSRRRARRSGH